MALQIAARRPFGHQCCNTVGEKPLQQIGMVRPEINEVVIVHGQPTAQPAIGRMLSAQSIQLAGAADPLNGDAATLLFGRMCAASVYPPK